MPGGRPETMKMLYFNPQSAIFEGGSVNMTSVHHPVFDPCERRIIYFFAPLRPVGAAKGIPFPRSLLYDE